MYADTQDRSVLERFYQAEQDSPQWLKDALNSEKQSLEQYFQFCDGCFKRYLIDDKALVLAEKTEELVLIHFSLLKGHKVEDEMIEDFCKIRDELPCKWIMGWVHTRNVKLQKVLERVGFSHYGVTMLKNHYKNRVCEWKNFTLVKDSKTL
jgi:hypothetical protein